MNEFNYEGWIGSIVGVYPSVSDFPSVGSEGCLYLIIDNGSGMIYAWDEANQSYVTAGGGSISGAIVYKGSVAASTDLPGSPEVGWLYVASADFTLSSESVEAGDFLIWDGSTWNIIQGNVTGAVSGPSSASDGHLAVFDGSSGKLIKDGGAMPDTYDFRASYNRAASTVSFSQTKKNGELFTGNLSAYAVKVVDNATVNMMSVGANASFASGAYTAHLSSSGIAFIDGGDTAVFKLGSADGTKLYDASYTVPLKTAAIASSAAGFTTSDQVYSYVAEHGFDPSSMPTVTETPSLLQAQADWNQNDNTAVDYIKNKPTIPTSNDVYEVSDLGLWVGSNTTHLVGKLYRNGVPVSNETFWFIGSYSDDSMTYSGSSRSGSTGNTGNFTYDIGNGSIGNNYNIKYFNVKVYNNSNQEKLLISYTYTRVTAASSIAASEAGYATGDQVYQVVGNIETLLAQI